MNRIIVVGGSAGSYGPLRTLLGGLPEDLAAPVCIVTHLAAQPESHLARSLQAVTKLPVRIASDGLALDPGTITVAAQDRHIMVVDGAIRLGLGPRENMSRPSIDPLFRSAAIEYGPGAIGVVLSGMLNDGASGLEAIMRMGGIAIVQSGEDAQYREMPDAAMIAAPAAMTVSAAEIAPMLVRLLGAPVSGHVPPLSDDLRIEVEIALGAASDAALMRRIAQPSTLTCPSCAGVLSEVNGSRPLRYRGQVGHGYTADVLDREKETQVDEALGIALRVIDERVELVGRMASDARTNGRAAVTALYEGRHAEYQVYAATIREAVTKRLQPLDADGELS